MALSRDEIVERIEANQAANAAREKRIVEDKKAAEEAELNAGIAANETRLKGLREAIATLETELDTTVCNSGNEVMKVYEKRGLCNGWKLTANQVENEIAKLIYMRAQLRGEKLAGDPSVRNMLAIYNQGYADAGEFTRMAQGIVDGKKRSEPSATERQFLAEKNAKKFDNLEGI
jgi:hypothetical protein